MIHTNAKTLLTQTVQTVAEALSTKEILELVATALAGRPACTDQYLVQELKAPAKGGEWVPAKQGVRIAAAHGESALQLAETFAAVVADPSSPSVRFEPGYAPYVLLPNGNQMELRRVRELDDEQAESARFLPPAQADANPCSFCYGGLQAPCQACGA